MVHLSPALLKALSTSFITSSANDQPTGSSRFAPTSTPDTIVAFEVKEPVLLPRAAPCTVELARHSFPFSYGHPFVGNFTPPTHCGSEWSKVVLTFTASVSGRQFDRLGAVWIGGAEALHYTTAEPSGSPVTTWSVQKDITSLSPILAKPQTVVVALDNVVDATYTGIFNVTVKADFYPVTRQNCVPESVPNVVIPISASTDSYGWFTLPNRTLPDSGVGAFVTSQLPTNAIKAEIEVFISGHGNDEFWYFNTPNEIASADNGVFPGGSYKDVQVSIDGKVVGVDLPFPVIYTGGLNPYLWRPMVSIQGFDVLSHKYDITPFLPLLYTNPGQHRISFNVTSSANDYWVVSGLLKIWTDGKPTTAGKFSGKLDEYAFNKAIPVYRYTNLTDGFVNTAAETRFHASGSIFKRDGSVIKTTVSRSGSFSNKQTYFNQGNGQTVAQLSNLRYEVTTITSRPYRGPTVRYFRQDASYPLKIDINYVSNGSLFELFTNVTMKYQNAARDTGVFVLDGYTNYWLTR
eukprot:jgi/Hompol1/982/HPOL_005476-RA